jgi:AraC-like DNA-binding protein
MKNYYLKQTGNLRFSDLQFRFCGRQTCEPLYSYGPCVRPTYIIHYILEGKGIFQAAGETFHVREKEGFLIEPGLQTFYQADKKDPWTYCWIGFDGTLAPVLLKELGLGDNRLTFCCNEIDKLRDIFAALSQYQQFSQVNDLLLESELYRFFSVLLKNCQIREGTGGSKNNHYVEGAVRYIRNNYFHPIKVSDIAAYVGIDRSYLYVLFRAETGMGLQQYLTNFRLTTAAELVTLTSYPIESVALSCGYQDALVFSKAFKKMYGMTPMQYRKAERNK